MQYLVGYSKKILKKYILASAAKYSLLKLRNPTSAARMTIPGMPLKFHELGIL